MLIWFVVFLAGLVAAAFPPFRDLVEEHVGRVLLRIFLVAFLLLLSFGLMMLITTTLGPGIDELGGWFKSNTEGVVRWLLSLVLIPLYLAAMLLTIPGIIVGLTVQALWGSTVGTLLLIPVVFFLPTQTYLLTEYVLYLTTSHPAERTYRQALAEELPVGEIAKRVAQTLSDVEQTWGRLFAIPSEWQSRLETRRVRRFTERIKAEEVFMQELATHLKTRARFAEQAHVER